MRLTITLLLGIMLIGLCSAQIDSLTQIQGECITLRQEASNSTYTNLTSITYPNTTTIYLETNMTKNGQTYTYDFCNTQDLGEYSYCTDTDEDGTSTKVCTSFDITPSGREAITEGESGSLIISIVIMLIIMAFFFIMGFKVENLAGKIILFGTASILLLMVLLFSLVTMNQILGGFSTILEGYSTFWFVVKVIFGIALTGLTLFILWFAYQAFMIKRGFRD